MGCEGLFARFTNRFTPLKRRGSLLVSINNVEDLVVPILMALSVVKQSMQNQIRLSELCACPSTSDKSVTPPIPNVMSSPPCQEQSISRSNNESSNPDRECKDVDCSSQSVEVGVNVVSATANPLSHNTLSHVVFCFREETHQQVVACAGKHQNR
jgi:hypothetical protein